MRLFSPLNCGLLFSDLFRTHTVNQSWGTLKWRTDISLTAALMSTGPGQFQHICASATARPAANHHRLFVDRGRAPDLTPLSPRRGGGSPSGHQSHRDQCSVFLLCSGRLVNPITAQRPPPPQSGVERLQTERDQNTEPQVTNWRKAEVGNEFRNSCVEQRGRGFSFHVSEGGGGAKAAFD